MNTQLSPCGGTIYVGNVILASAEANPEVVVYKWFVDNANVSRHQELVVTEDMLGYHTNISCQVENIMRDGLIGSDTASCTFTIEGNKTT